MGGMNHQPCGKYLANSTALSRACSAFASTIQRANIALEDVILAELADGRGDWLYFLDLLIEAEGNIESVGNRIKMLRAQMDEAGFRDLPTLSTVNLDALGNAYALEGLADLRAWQRIHGVMKEGGFYAILGLFDKKVIELMSLTSVLRTTSEALHDAARQGSVERILEENRPGNIKVHFARLFTKWHEFEQLFLASSMISTELYYAFNGHGSLVGSSTLIKVA